MGAGAESAEARALPLTAGATVAIATSAGLLLAGLGRAAGVAAGLAGLALVIGGRLAARRGRPRDRVADSLADRLFDAGVLGAVAWTAREGDPTTSAGALVALAAGFLGSYVRARGASLGYGVEESPVTRGLRYGLVSGGLLTGWLPGTIWAAAAVSAVATAVRASQVAKEERA